MSRESKEMAQLLLDNTSQTFFFDKKNTDQLQLHFIQLYLFKDHKV